MSAVTPGPFPGAARQLLDPLSTLAFWVAIALPAGYLPLFLAGIDTAADLGLFLGLFGLHVVALLLGHGHGPDAPEA